MFTQSCFIPIIYTFNCLVITSIFYLQQGMFSLGQGQITWGFCKDGLAFIGGICVPFPSYSLLFSSCFHSCYIVVWVCKNLITCLSSVNEFRIILMLYYSPHYLIFKEVNCVLIIYVHSR